MIAEADWETLAVGSKNLSKTEKIKYLRDQGLSWGQIGKLVGLTRQAAQQSHKRNQC